MAPRLVRYDADDGGTGEVWLDGETVVWSELSRPARPAGSGGSRRPLAGRPGAARAAGTFCARNRLALFVPCHRVVAAGGIGSYGSLGLDYKRRLLALEGVVL